MNQNLQQSRYMVLGKLKIEKFLAFLIYLLPLSLIRSYEFSAIKINYSNLIFLIFTLVFLNNFSSINLKLNFKIFFFFLFSIF